MGQIQNLEDLIIFLRRNLGFMAIVVLIGSVLSVFVALQTPKTFEGIAVLQVRTPIVEQVQSNGQATPSSAAQKLQSIEQLVTTRESLAALIERHGLFKDLPALSLDDKIALFRMQFRFQAVESNAGSNFGQPKAISAIIIYAQAHDADTAANVANDFAQLLLDLSVEQQRGKTEGSVTFFKGEEAALWERLSRLEAEISEYKNANIDALPELADARRDELIALEAEIREYDLEKKALQIELDQIKAKADLRETDRRRAEELVGEINLLTAQANEITVRRDEIAGALAKSPEIDRILGAYDRERQQLRDQYNLVSGRLAEAETELRLTELNQDERFSFLERAIPPEFPIGTGRRKVAMLGVAVSGALAAFLAFLWELLRPIVRTSRQMERQLGLKPVVAIPKIKRRKSLAGPSPRMISSPFDS